MILRCVPHFIYENYLSGNFNGTLIGTALFLDIVGFTSLTEKLMSSGKEGAEILSDLLARLLSNVINEIHQSEGFVSHFTGDAVTAIFPEPVPAMNACKVAWNIQKSAARNKSLKTRFGEFSLAFKIGICFGSIHWGIFGKNRRKGYYFRGDAILGAASAERQCPPHNIVVSKNVIMQSGDVIRAENISSTLARIVALDWEIVHSEQSGQITPAPSIEKTADFISPDFLHSEFHSEFREVIAIFIVFDGQDDEHQFLDTIMKMADSYGAYFEGVDFADKGNSILLIFGAPITYEDSNLRARRLLRTLKQLGKGGLHIGVTQGIVYAGIKGSVTQNSYGVIGNTVNFAARIASIAQSDEIIVSENISVLWAGEATFTPLGHHSLKGKKTSQRLFLLEFSSREQNLTSSSSDYIGRVAEREKIESVISNTMSGFANLLYILGEPGTGKTFLVRHFEEQFQENRIFCYIRADVVLQKSFQPFIDLFHEYFHIDMAMGELQRRRTFEENFTLFMQRIEQTNNVDRKRLKSELVRLQSVFAAFLSIETEGSLYSKLDPPGRYDNSIQAILEFMKALCSLKTTVLVIDDLHAIDEDSRYVMKKMTKALANFPFMMVLASRFYDDSSIPLIENEGNIPKHIILLQNFDDNEASEFIQKQLNITITEKSMNTLLQISNGNPLYLEQYCLFLNQMHSLNDDTNIENDDILGGEIPREINQILLARLDKLPPLLVKIIKVAAVVGIEFDLLTVQHSLTEKGKKPAIQSIREQIEHARKNQLCHRVGENRYEFNNKLLREVAYEMQMRKEIRKIHRRVARWYIDTYSQYERFYADIAYHFEKGEDRASAQEYYCMAVTWARKSYLNENALHYIEKALTLSEDLLTKLELNYQKALIFNLIGKWNEACNILEKIIETVNEHQGNFEKILAESFISLAMIKQNLGLLDDAHENLDNAEVLLKKINAPDILMILLNQRGIICLNTSAFEKALHNFNKYYELAEERGDVHHIARATGSIGNWYNYQSLFEKSLTYYQKSLELFNNIDEKRGKMIVLGNMGIVLRHLGRWEKAGQCFSQQYNTSLELGDKQSTCLVLNNLGLLYQNQNKREKALQTYNECLTICEELGFLTGIAKAYGNIGVVHESQGKLIKARECFDKALQIFERLGDKQGLASVLGNIGLIYKNLGLFNESLKYHQKDLTVSQELGDKIGICMAYGNLAITLAFLKDFEKCYLYLEEAINQGKILNIPYQLSSFLFHKADIFLNTTYSIHLHESVDALLEAEQICADISRTDLKEEFEIMHLKRKALVNGENVLKNITELFHQEKSPYYKLMLACLLLELYPSKTHEKFVLKLYHQDNCISNLTPGMAHTIQSITPLIPHPDHAP